MSNYKNHLSDNVTTVNSKNKRKSKDSNPPSKRYKNKKFVAPVKLANNENNIPKQNIYNNAMENFQLISPTQSQNEFNSSSDYLEPLKRVTYNKGFDKPPKYNLNKEFSLDGLILNSFNVLNDEDIQLYASQVSQKSDKMSQKSISDNISRNNSICSVTSLNKTYKNLDMKSFENIQNQNDFLAGNNDKLNNDISTVNNKEPVNEFLKLFKNGNLNKITKAVPMSTQYGDMGLNYDYSDYIKKYGHLEQDNHLNAEAEDTVRKILELYSNENKFLISMKCSMSIN